MDLFALPFHRRLLVRRVTCGRERWCHSWQAKNRCWLAGRDLAVFGGQPTGEDVDQHGDRAGDKRGDHDPEADGEHVDVKPIGESGAHAHDLGAAAIDDEATVHGSHFLVQVAVQAIGSEVAAETNSSEVMNAPARLTASWRPSRNE